MEEYSIDFSLEHHISGKDFLTAEGGLARVKWLHDQVDQNGLYFLQDGQFSRYLLREITSCFINGQFISTIVLGLSFIERTIAGRFNCNGDNPKKESKELFSAARDKGWLTQREYDLIEGLRKLRNPIVHFRDPLDPDRPEVRAINESKSPHALLEEDAKAFLAAIISLLNKTAL